MLPSDFHVPPQCRQGRREVVSPERRRTKTFIWTVNSGNLHRPFGPAGNEDGPVDRAQKDQVDQQRDGPLGSPLANNLFGKGLKREKVTNLMGMFQLKNSN